MRQPFSKGGPSVTQPFLGRVGSLLRCCETASCTSSGRREPICSNQFMVLGVEQAGSFVGSRRVTWLGGTDVGGHACVGVLAPVALHSPEPAAQDVRLHHCVVARRLSPRPCRPKSEVTPSVTEHGRAVSFNVHSRAPNPLLPISRACLCIFMVRPEASLNFKISADSSECLRWL